ncbi:MAG TPA: monovalent cation:proton antiporter-2 (CPA2) family protein [Gammaproteobacteria bacterium]|nr:monovalent cation:proton antiporter-2 (CPA2) family protein [Gammaproteobacteria bacterium]
MSVLNEAIIFLIAAVIAVLLSRRFGLGSILGYLIAGIMIGPWGLGLIQRIDDTLHLAELGVVLLLFIIGLELQPTRLWVLRKPLFSLGGLQMALSTLALGGIAMGLGLSWQTALVIGLSLSLSSTAFALQMLGEKNQLLTLHGRGAFSILLFQDLLVIPALALMPLLTGQQSTHTETHYLEATIRSIAIIFAVIAAGHYLIRPVLRQVAKAGIPELFSAASLLVVLGTAELMHIAGLSMALGAFLAGVLLADSEFRHELEASIEPFKGLLLGLFFISVGMSVDLDLVLAEPLLITALTLGLLSVKIAVLCVIGKLSRYTMASALSLAIVISQGGEFAFVLLAQANLLGIIDKKLADMLVVAVALSMALTPPLVALQEYWASRRNLEEKPERPFDAIEDDNPKVIIAGFGRFGQVTARILSMKGIRFTALEANFEQVDFVRKFGNKVYFGDASRLELLRAAHADKAQIFVLAIVNLEASLRTAEIVKKHFPNLKIFARARNRQHVYKLMDIGVDYVIRETILSGIDLAQNVLQGLGFSEDESQRIAQAFRAYDEDLVKKQHAIYQDEEQMIAAAKRAAAELKGLFEQDKTTNIAAETEEK